ncbi:hypothetical protein EJ02DRAFT_358880 [Clathrospora elynae]|uniref:RING-type E3 ubiquitin transferase n=1 Tax=Clathrospora elynae TaxID=706981 RepID=A0A6A5SAI0_9PLEO|nr:hypothetical protein EJ02DRAFT_358880 [Clathrospora elynae]
MRPLRLLLSLSTSLIAVTLLLYIVLASSQNEEREETSAGSRQSNMKALFSFTSPGSLFPPSAIISLTDDNSTFFLARPAAFGSALPKDGLSGPLWIGSGFLDDTTGRGGELGCSDVPGWAVDGMPKHADIQSMQESAEIAGKVVLLKRGGCGFLAKVQWAQTRGGVAVIVGDNVRGGALVRMYAQGDTSNITIPSLFTSHTTAHLLSSLLPTGGILSESAHHADASVSDNTISQDERAGWLHSFLSAIGFGADTVTPKAGSRRLPSSGHLDWIKAGDWDDDQKPIRTKTATPSSTSTGAPDRFVIGEQDWRDRDLLPFPSSTNQVRKVASATPILTKAGSNALPGSGEYPHMAATDAGERTWWSTWSGSNDASAPPSPKHSQGRSVAATTGADLKIIETSSHPPGSHEGLWVTLTPTNVSSSPFFDTLLVLVVSPLVTLTVVYALLLLRSRIRRRRWRAPKSVVERLPVRTYQTISESSSAATPSASSPTTPLLQHTPSRSAPAVSRSRSTTESDVPATSTSVQHASPDREEEKRESGLAAWRRRYGGRQRECVVCLEDYVDGVSQVMSLPCGHEFHADCITPWLVTRRRTCPICKGDVVRSLSQSHHERLQSPSPTRSARLPGSEDDVQTEAAETRNDSPSASRPVPVSILAPAITSPIDDDVEAAWSGDGSRRNARDIPQTERAELSSSLRELSSTVSTVVWRGFDAVRNSTGFQRRPPPGDVDRDR